MNQPDWPPSIAGGDDVTFESPWQARVFAIAVCLHERGLYSWAEWADALAARITAAQAAGDADMGDTYYHHWLCALEDLLARKGVEPDETTRWHDAWQRAAHRTPHGQPIEVQPSDFDAGPDE
ncbi:nitrile hydratase accessory protein [Mycobacterium sp. CPCC 205372]|uniref:Nitrile hydratase accessory protein n=1 Tax=Mycobacterium hippophais TaxID=3016340 RepID=A0ABT4PPH8_9MYCO|nr:nitrile hydratase accessory protein [Mycobacterium hippophais]MCZ8378465.1 nitrile hydratase accessory protein [Mycobacterium hippophais]